MHKVQTHVISICKRQLLGRYRICCDIYFLFIFLLQCTAVYDRCITMSPIINVYIYIEAGCIAVYRINCLWLPLWLALGRNFKSKLKKRRKKTMLFNLYMRKITLCSCTARKTATCLIVMVCGSVLEIYSKCMLRNCNTRALCK